MRNLDTPLGTPSTPRVVGYFIDTFDTLRRERKLTLKNVSDLLWDQCRLKYGVSSLSKTRNGDRGVDIMLVHGLATIFGVSPAVFFDIKEDSPPPGGVAILPGTVTEFRVVHTVKIEPVVNGTALQPEINDGSLTY